MKNLLSSYQLENICGDKKLSIIGKIYWILVCIINYILSFKIKIDPRIKLERLDKINKSFVNMNDSPSRVLSDIFWQSFPWEKKRKILKKKFDILEIGCGDGKYGFLLRKILKKNFKNYLGIDIRKRDNWSNKKKNFRFIKKDCYKIKKYLHKKNLIITQSALEHFKYDLKFMKILRDNISKKNKIIQIHLIPSYSCLYTYLWHGYRHYNLNSISKITRIFNNNCQFRIYPLGSTRLNLYHFFNITIKKNKSQKLRNKKKKYFKKMYSLISKSFKLSESTPSFYALVIFHNFKKKL